MTDTVLDVELRASYGKQPALRDIRFSLRAGEVLGLVGTSGAGKSTLILSLLGLLPWRGGRVTGRVLLTGQDLLSLRERDARKLRGKAIALVPQSPMTALNSAASLRAHFEEAWRAHDTRGRSALDARLVELFPEVQLRFDPDFLRKRPSQISVGQAQRIMIALALLHRPSVLLADEPTSALDPVTQSEIVCLLRHVTRTQGTALLYVSHDLISVLQLADTLAVLDSGAIVESLPVSGLTSHAQHPATLALLRSLPFPLEALLSSRSADDARSAETLASACFVKGTASAVPQSA